MSSTTTASPASTSASGKPAHPVIEFSWPGPLRDRLVAAVLDGSKTSTTSLLQGYAATGTEPRQVGDRSVVIDSHGVPVAIIETMSIRFTDLANVDLPHCIDEGEGHMSVAEWRAAHEIDWHSTEQRLEFGDPAFTVDEDTPLVLEHFRLVADLRA
ncbi:ASCH domain-containing protein [Actinorhabdospora filicis]|uniref:ASCH domain-containing protein n=1 Tax=Actinorhabdospora filicis TaxID=1785913 RepID=A0A9W6WDX9_9ACTN|nr:ASCH domain-containing protein [Actinorhabdospora filicis]GLZ81305.1 ASCH domain-containing protein [Actinorhabdospora filicis]